MDRQTDRQVNRQVDTLVSILTTRRIYQANVISTDVDWDRIKGFIMFSLLDFLYRKKIHFRKDLIGLFIPDDKMCEQIGHIFSNLEQID